MKNVKKDRLRTTLDRLPEGTDEPVTNLKVSARALPEGVRNQELYSDIIRIAFPSFVELILTQLASMVDLMMVGSIGGKAAPELGTMALSAVGLTTQPKFLLMAAFIAMNTGVTAMVARYKGIGDKEKANLVVRQGLFFTFVTTLIISALGIMFSPQMVVLMGGKEDQVIEWGVIYLRIQLAGFLTMALTSTITASLRGVGDSRTSMYYNLIANIVNVFFNWMLIYGNLGMPEMGVAGASLATVIGQLVAFVISLTVILRGNSFLKLELRKGFRPDGRTLGDLLNIGIPSMIEQLLMRVGLIVFSITVANLGTVAFATHQVCMNIQALSFMTGQAFAVSSTSLTGQCLGKKRTDMAQAYCSRTQRLAIAVGLVLTIVFVFFGGQIVGLYNSSPEVIHMGGRIMFFVAFAQPLQASQFVLAGGLRGAGDTRSTAIIITLTTMLLRPLLAILLVSQGMGIYGAWAALICDQILRSLLVYLRYHSGRWKLIKLKSEQTA